MSGSAALDELSVIDSILGDGARSWTLDFWTKPLTFEEFVTHPDHARSVKLTPRQTAAVKAFIGDDPVFMFDRQNRGPNMGAWAWGKGSGKNMVATILQQYLFYVLMCMRNPLGYFGFPDGESIDMVNVAANASQAKKNFFDKFVRRVKSWKWLREHYAITQHGRPICAPENHRGTIRITEDSVEWEGGVKCISAHSDSKGYEGYSILFFVMDEASSWETEYVQLEGGDLAPQSKAHNIFDTLRTSALSRSWKWRGLVISYPRQEDDFTLSLAQDILDGKKEGIADIAATWEVKPTHLWQDPTPFEHKVVRPTGVKLIYPPMDFFTEFRDYPQQSELKYACIPSRTKAYFIYNDLKIHECAEERAPVVHLREMSVEGMTPMHREQTAYRAYEVASIETPNPEYDYFAHVDLAVAKDMAIVGIGHGEPYTAEVTLPQEDGSVLKQMLTRRVVIDQLIAWVPDNRHMISTVNIDTVLGELDEVFRFRHLSYDQFQSSYVLEKAARSRKSCSQHNVNNNDYFLLRGLIHANAIVYPKSELLVYELTKLIWNGKRVEHLATASKDYSDVVAALSQAVMSEWGERRRRVQFWFG